MARQLGPHQRQFFDKLKSQDRERIIGEQERELATASFFPPSPQRDERIAELQLRIEYLKKGRVNPG